MDRVPTWLLWVGAIMSTAGAMFAVWKAYHP